MARGRYINGPVCRDPKLLIGFSLGLLISAGPVSADGEFFQLDLSKETTIAVSSLSRGDYSFGVSYADYDGGRNFLVQGLYALPHAEVPFPTVLKIGPSFGLIDKDDIAGGPESVVGLKLVAERFQTTDFGSLFLLADLNTIESEWFFMGQAGIAALGVNVEISVSGGDSYEEQTIAISKRLATMPVSLRAGYRLDADEVFVGLSYNTF